MVCVAAYCRVSTDREDQANSFETQCSFFREYIKNRPEWELYQVYADEGITGTSTKKRIEFLRMMADARERRFDLIVTKEVSRFSRNILDTIACTRELKSLGVGVLFVTDGIHTLEPDAELRLSIMASMAQEESRKTSCRVVWGQTRQMEKGIVFGRSMLGYKVENGKLSVEPNGADVVRNIFDMYALEQLSTQMIARRLTSMGIQTSRGNTTWSSTAIARILKNEKYIGDLVQKKTYTADYLTHEKKANHGEVPTIIIREHHTPIINREIWNLAQERLAQSNKHAFNRSGHSSQFAFSGKIRCGECGCIFVGRTRSVGENVVRYWRCATATREGGTLHCNELGIRTGCNIGKMINDDKAWSMLQTALRWLTINFVEYIGRISATIADAVKTADIASRDISRLRAQVVQINEKLERVMDSYFSAEITNEEMQTMKKRYHCKLHSLQIELEQVEKNSASLDQNMITGALSALLDGQTRSDVLCKSILESITVFRDRHMELKLHHFPCVFHFFECSEQKSTRHA